MIKQVLLYHIFTLCQPFLFILTQIIIIRKYFRKIFDIPKNFFKLFQMPLLQSIFQKAFYAQKNLRREFPLRRFGLNAALMRQSYSASQLKRITVGTFGHCGIRLMRSDHNFRKRAVIGAAAMMRALSYRTFNTFVSLASAIVHACFHNLSARKSRHALPSAGIISAFSAEYRNTQ